MVVNMRRVANNFGKILHLLGKCQNDVQRTLINSSEHLQYSHSQELGILRFMIIHRANQSIRCHKIRGSICKVRLTDKVPLQRQMEVPILNIIKLNYEAECGLNKDAQLIQD